MTDQPPNRAIWIDVDNSPHVPLFAPLVKHYRESGVDVIMTARDHAQTIELLRLSGLEGTFTVVGRHYGKSKLNKIRGLFARTVQLVSHIKRARRAGAQIAVAVSHGSRAMVLAAKWLKIPIITMYDYEFTETGIFNRFSDRVLVPAMIPDPVLDEIGLPASKRIKYQGIKEELYVGHFRPVEDARARLFENHGVRAPAENILVVVRPPATTANYHAEQSEILLDAILQHLLLAADTFTVIVPRTRKQASGIGDLLKKTARSSNNSLILDTAVDGLDLAFVSDLLISGGGTMNREAMLLGVPVYSIFAGRQGALDAQMEKEGLITFIRTQADIAKIKLEKRKAPNAAGYSNSLTDRVERFVIEQINCFLEKG